MGRHSTLPTLFDEVKYISITNLRKWEYLVPYQYKSGTITWSRNGNKTDSIDIRVSMYENCYLELDYQFRGEPVNYKVPLIKVPSNLGKGEIWFFVCPVTGKHCRKLYSIGKYFLHREAAKGYYYEKQTYSKKSRYLFRMYEYLNASDKIHLPYFKRFYNGKATKRYMKLMNQLKQTKGLTLEQLIIL